MDIELIELVESELRFLKKEWNQSIEDDTLRRSSNVLRVLLVDNNLQRAWKEVGFEKQPKVTTPTLDNLFNFLYSEAISPKHIKFTQAGGAEVVGGAAQGFWFLDIALSESQIKASYDLRLSIKVLDLSEFIEAPCIYVNGLSVNRRKLIQYVANKLGGTHYDPIRNITKDKERKFSELDNIRKSFKLMDKNAIYFELLSIGQAINQSEDIQSLQEKLESMLLN